MSTPPHKPSHKPSHKSSHQSPKQHKAGSASADHSTTASDTEFSPEDMSQDELLNKVIEYGNLSKRLAADYQNLQRETEDRVKRMQIYANEQLILEIAPLVDYFHSAFAAVPKDEQGSSWLQGIQHIQTQLMNILQQHGVEVIEAVGRTFDPELHDAVSEEVSDQPPHTVITQVQAGITLHNKVIRPAKVVVSRGPEINSEINPDTNPETQSAQPDIIN